MATYARRDLVFASGEGSWLVTSSGDRYLDFTSGIAVNVLGHAHPALVRALKDQADKLWHTSNLFRIAEQERLAERLCAATFAERVFFCNSGTEACEGAIKAVRRYHHVGGSPEKNRIITFNGSFHGRSLTALAAAGNEKHLDGFAPIATGFDHIPFSDIDAVEAAITPETAAIMVEPIQGEGGVRTFSPSDLGKLRRLCDEHGLLLVLDEVQTGVGRTGKFFAHEWANIEPDIMPIAKGIGGGFPLGAILATEEAAKGMSPGSHGSTFGGNPLAMAVGNAVLDVVLEPGFLQDVQSKSIRWKQLLAEIHDRFPDIIEEIRGEGFLVGLKLKQPATQLIEAAGVEKLLLVGAGDNTVRVLPALTTSEDELVEGANRLTAALTRLKSTQS